MLLIEVVVCAKSKQRVSRLQSIGTIRHMRGGWPDRVMSTAAYIFPNTLTHS